jgi:hypothetical protein
VAKIAGCCDRREIVDLVGEIELLDEMDLLDLRHAFLMPGKRHDIGDMKSYEAVRDSYRGVED